MGGEKKWLFTLFSAAFLSLLLLFCSNSVFSSSRPLPSIVHHGLHYPPAFAYYISGGRGEGDQIFRLLLAVYHPRNRYLLRLTTDASDYERQQLAIAVESVPAIQAFGNVDVVGKPDRVTYMGSSNVATTSRAASILLKIDDGWDWFITLRAMDYPLITQDDLSRVFYSVRRDLNFIDHTGDLGCKESQRVQPIVVDPGIYLARRSQIFHATEKRQTPDASKFSRAKSNLNFSNSSFLSFVERRIWQLSIWISQTRVMLFILYHNNFIHEWMTHKQHVRVRNWNVIEGQEFRGLVLWAKEVVVDGSMLRMEGR